MSWDRADVELVLVSLLLAALQVVLIGLLVFEFLPKVGSF